MRPGRVGGFRPFARAGAIASIALIGMMFSGNAAFAATVIGSALGNTPCNYGFDTVQLSSTGVSYAIPAGGGSISSWTTYSGPNGGMVGLQVWRPLATVPPSYQLVGESPLVTPLGNSLTTFPLTTPIPVLEGDLLGLRIDGFTKAYCEQFTPGSTDTYGGHMGGTPTVGTVATFTSNLGTLDVEATVDAVITPAPPPPANGCDSPGEFSGNDVCVQ